jgi:uroporphyrinogen decarboxylase
VSGTPEDIKTKVQTVIQNAPQRFILGADCTLPGDIHWTNIRQAISTAHNFTK